MTNLINLNLFNLSYGNLKAFAQTIHDGFVDHAVEYSTPIPAPAAFQTDIDDFDAAIAKWGTKGNHGSHNDHLALIAQRTVIRNDLRTLASYAMVTKPLDPDSWSKLGFAIKRPKSKPVTLQAVQNFRHFISRDVDEPQIKLKWKRPLDTQKTDVKGYIVQRNNTSTYPVSVDGQALANIIGIIPNTSFIDVNPLVGENYYWVVPFNAIGNGVKSAALKIVSTKIAP